MSQVDRVFNHRNPWTLVVGLLVLAISGAFGILFSVASARGEVTVNGVPGDGQFQLGPAIFAILVSVPFIVLSMMILLSFFFERIVWRGGVVSWYDRLGRLRVRSRIEDIYDVVREDTPLATNADEGVQVMFGSGPFRDRGKRPLEKIVICTANGDIPFYETSPWAEELESLAREVVLNKTPKRDMGQSWPGGW